MLFFFSHEYYLDHISIYSIKTQVKGQTKHTHARTHTTKRTPHESYQQKHPSREANTQYSNARARLPAIWGTSFRQAFSKHVYTSCWTLPSPTLLITCGPEAVYGTQHSAHQNKPDPGKKAETRRENLLTAAKTKLPCHAERRQSNDFYTLPETARAWRPFRFKSGPIGTLLPGA